MKRRALLQSILLTTGGVFSTSPASAVERPANFDASKELEKPDWKPIFFDEHQDRTLIVFSDLLIPATDTPGAKDALVNRFLDQFMAAEREDTQRGFLASLAFLDGESMRLYKQAFVYLDQPSQIELLHFMAYPHSLSRWGEAAVTSDSYSHFTNLKQWVATTYYNSPAGMKELGWDGVFPHGEFTGCDGADTKHSMQKQQTSRDGGHASMTLAKE